MVKIKCEVCESAETNLVLCCSDEAVLCEKCDQKIDASNKLFSRHHRLSLLKLTSVAAAISSNDNNNDLMPLCDRCKKKSGYVFCLEERTLLCKTCDDEDESVVVEMQPSTDHPSLHHQHMAHHHHHHRFLIAGFKVTTRDSVVAQLQGLTSSSSSSSSSSSDFPASQLQEYRQLVSVVGGDDDNDLEPWCLDEIFRIGDFDASHFDVCLN